MNEDSDTILVPLGIDEDLARHVLRRTFDRRDAIGPDLAAPLERIESVANAAASGGRFPHSLYEELDEEVLLPARKSPAEWWALPSRGGRA